jgi:hypothetical protein
MNPNLYKKGGKVAHKQLGGGMPMGYAPRRAAAPVAVAPVVPMSRAEALGLSPAARADRIGMLRRQIPIMVKEGGSASQCAKLQRELKHHESLSAKKAHGKASGGEIDSAETRTTLKNSVKPYAKTKMDTAHRDSAHGTGEVKIGKPGGYAMGGTIEGNEGPYENTKMVSAGKGKTNGTTGGVRMGNAGGFKHGGKAKRHYAKGGHVPGLTSATIEGGNWENRPANTSKPGKTNTKTGEVKESNAGGYKKGGHAKKAYATGGNVVDDGRPEKYPRHFVSQPVANSLQSGTFRKGGKVRLYADGNPGKPISTAQQNQAYKDWKKGEEEWNASFRPENLIGKAVDKVKGLFASKPETPPAGSVTKTEKSVTVAPAKKRGGRAC